MIEPEPTTSSLGLRFAPAHRPAGEIEGFASRPSHEPIGDEVRLWGRRRTELHDWIPTVLLGLLILSFASLILGIFHQNVSGDEFFFLHKVYRAANDQPLGLLQTSYAHLFGWLTQVEGDEIDQIQVARLVYLVIWAGSLTLLYALARRLLDPLGALASVVLFALFSYSVPHAASFRIDGLLLPLLLSAALLLLHPTTFRVGAAGAVSGLATALSIKTVLWAPALACVLAVGLQDRRDRAVPVLAGALAACITLGAILAAHSWLVATETAQRPGISAETVSRIGAYMLIDNGLFPRWNYVADSVRGNLVTWTLLFAGLCITLQDLRRPQTRRSALLLLSLALPIVSVAFYANAFPYAYLVLFPTACLLAGRAFSRLASGAGWTRAVAGLTCLVVAALPLARITSYNWSDKQAEQKQLLAIVHDLFETPVSYIDAGGMVSSFPRAGVFLSEVGLKLYRERGAPILTRYIEEAKPPLLLATIDMLDIRDGGAAEALDPKRRLLPADEEAIRRTYAHYRDRVYLAGQAWRDVRAGVRLEFEIRIPGQYTIVSQGPVVVDGQAYGRGASITLAAGPHNLRTKTRELDLRVLWGANVALPSPITTLAR